VPASIAPGGSEVIRQPDPMADPGGEPVPVVIETNPSRLLHALRPPKSEAILFRTPKEKAGGSEKDGSLYPLCPSGSASALDRRTAVNDAATIAVPYAKGREGQGRDRPPVRSGRLFCGVMGAGCEDAGVGSGRRRAVGTVSAIQPCCLGVVRRVGRDLGRVRAEFGGGWRGDFTSIGRCRESTRLAARL